MDRSHLPDRATAAAVELESLAAAIEARGPASGRSLVRVADLLLWTPLVHPLRTVERTREDGAVVLVDRVVEMSDEVRRGQHNQDPAPLRAFAAELRAGLPKMRATGWGWLLRGGAES